MVGGGALLLSAVVPARLLRLAAGEIQRGGEVGRPKVPSPLKHSSVEDRGLGIPRVGAAE